MRITASLGGRIAALCLILLLVGMVVLNIRAANATRDSINAAHEASAAGQAYEDARYRFGQLQLATQVHLATPSEQSRTDFESAVDEMLAALERLGEVGTPADQAAVKALYADTAPSLDVLKRIFRAIETGQPITDEIPGPEIAQRYSSLLEPLAAKYDAAAQKALDDLQRYQAKTTRIRIIVGVGGLLAAVFLLLAIQRFGTKAAVHEMEAALLRTAAMQDSLTALGNHRAYREEIRRQFARATRHNEPVSAVMLDVDTFKHVNDTWGHKRGDEVLRSIAEVLRRESREDDYCFRIGGDEFAMILPRTTSADALAIVNRVRQAARLKLPEGPTLSAGIASTATGVEEGQLQEQADIALYVAKARGRDTAVLFEQVSAGAMADASQQLLAS